MVAVVLVVIAAAVVVVVLLDPFGGGKNARPGVADNAYPTAVATVDRRSLSSQTEVDGTLRFAGSYSVVNGAAGPATALPHLGQVIRRGEVLYRLAGKPVLLLYGGTPAYRALKKGMSGWDVRELNANLAALGYGTAWLDPTSVHFSAATKYALRQLQDALGFKQTGKLDLGRVVFLPGPARITKVLATLGTTVQPGAVVAQATSTRRQVTVDLDTDLQSSIKVGDRVRITLPNNNTTSGVVTSIGKIASSGSSGNATVPVHIVPRNPKITGSLDQATVQVAITTAKAKHALVVPVTALLALAGGGYAVETVDDRGIHHLVPIRLGLFDDVHGLAQVTSSHLQGGQKIVIPAS
jgi:hypothetical protein